MNRTNLLCWSFPYLKIWPIHIGIMCIHMHNVSTCFIKSIYSYLLPYWLTNTITYNVNVTIIVSVIRKKIYYQYFSKELLPKVLIMVVRKKAKSWRRSWCICERNTAYLLESPSGSKGSAPSGGHEISHVPNKTPSVYKVSRFLEYIS